MQGVNITLRDGGTYTIEEKQINYWQQLYPDVDVYNEIKELQELWEQNKLPRKTVKNVGKYINLTLMLLSNASNE